MNLIENIKEKAKSNPGRVAFPEANDAKMVQAIDEVSREKYCDVVIVGHIDEVKALCQESKIDDSTWNYVDSNDEEYKEKILQKYLKLPNLVYGEKSLRRRMNDPLYLAFMMEAIDEVDVTFAGITSTTGDIILAAQTIVGLNN